MRLPRLIKKINRRVRAIVVGPERLIRRYLAPTDAVLVRMGTVYGGWTVADTRELRNGVAVLCGAGEDVSFDLALQKRFGCEVLIVDPTPRAIEHFNELLAAFRENRPFAINRSSETYDLAEVDIAKIKYVPVAIWTARDTLKFWMPQDPSHVSHSITNLQRSSQYIEVQADTLSAVLSSHGLLCDELELLKLDIEGAETEIIAWLCENRVFPRQLLVEFDEVHFPRPIANRKIESSINLLLANGYRMAHYDGLSNCLFLR